MNIEYVKVGELQGYEFNTRTHSDEQVDQLAASIGEFGFTNPLLIDGERQIIAGHGRLAAATKIGMDEVPCIVLDHLTEAQRRAYVIADNKLALNAGWDEDLLKLELSALDQIGFDLSVVGFDADELSGLVIDEDIAGGLTDEDDVPELAEIPISKPGDIWLLDNHRVMCGDSTSADDVAKLCDGKSVDMVYTDPPYGIDEKGDRSNRGGIGKGGLAKACEYKDFKDDSIDYAVKAYEIVNQLGVKRQVWWGANYYCHYLPQSNNWFVWDKRVEDKQKNTESDCEMAWVKSKWSSIRIFRHLWKGMMKDSERGQARVHPTQKPVALAEWSFDYFRDVESVLDLFGGSGSTLIACQKTNRQCFMMEFDDHYCDVIVKRWQEYTGKQAVHSVSGLSFNEVADAKQVA